MPKASNKRKCATKTDTSKKMKPEVTEEMATPAEATKSETSVESTPEEIMINIDKPLTKGDIVSHIAKKEGLNLDQVSAVLDDFRDLIYASAKAEMKFSWSGIGNFNVQNRAERTGHHPRTGEAITIPAHKAIKFTVAKAWSEQVK